MFVIDAISVENIFSRFKSIFPNKAAGFIILISFKNLMEKKNKNILHKYIPYYKY